MKFLLRAFLPLLCAACSFGQAKPGALTIYVLDLEGDGGTLYISPSGESLLLDSGGGGGRDAGRILDAIRDAGITQLDYAVTSHYDGDHVGGLKEISEKIPIRTFVDHGTRVPEGGQLTGFQATYPEVYAKGKRIIAKPGDKLALKGMDVSVISSNAETIQKPLPGAGKPNPYCSSFKPRDEEPDENHYSVGLLFTVGKFRTINLADLVWDMEAKFMCPNNLIGAIDLYLTSHHGLDRSGSPAMVHALHPQVAIVTDGYNKGGTPQTYTTLETSPGLGDIWALHWSSQGSLEYNPPGRYIANLETPESSAETILHPPPPVNWGGRPRGTPAPTRGAGGGGRAAAGASGGRGGAVFGTAHSPAYWIKITAKPTGEFTVTNQRNGFSKTYQSTVR
jgi:competence protein ComEC